MSYSTTRSPGSSVIHKVTGGLIILLSIIGLLGTVTLASELGAAFTLIAVLFGVLQIGIGIGLIIGTGWASTVGKLYYGISLVLSLVMLNFIGVGVALVILVLLFAGDYM